MVTLLRINHSHDFMKALCITTASTNLQSHINGSKLDPSSPWLPLIWAPITIFAATAAAQFRQLCFLQSTKQEQRTRMAAQFRQLCFLPPPLSLQPAILASTPRTKKEKPRKIQICPSSSQACIGSSLALVTSPSLPTGLSRQAQPHENFPDLQ